MNVEDIMRWLRERDEGCTQLHDVVHELAEAIVPFAHRNRVYESERILQRLIEPDRVLQFRVVWENDHGATMINRGWRVQHSNVLGPYKGGLRFDSDVNLDVLRALAFEQTFKNALTGIPLGGAKGGSDFSPRGRSDREILRFCRAFMGELHRHIGEDVDVPAGDIGVGEREIGYLMGGYRKLTGVSTGVLTGKGLAYGGSEIRAEATGFGAVYFAEAMVQHLGEALEGRVCLVSGAGSVAMYAAQKLIERGAVVKTLSDRGGTLVVPRGIDEDLLEELKNEKLIGHGSLRNTAESRGLKFVEGAKPWGQTEAVDMVFPCATQNEIDESAARSLVEAGASYVIEGANMPCTAAARAVFKDAGVARAPGKAANAGGVAISGVEMMQNRINSSWSRERVHEHLKNTMRRIHEACVEHGSGDGVDYPLGADIAGFKRVADALLSYGPF